MALAELTPVPVPVPVPKAADVALQEAYFVTTVSAGQLHVSETVVVTMFSSGQLHLAVGVLTTMRTVSFMFSNARCPSLKLKARSLAWVVRLDLFEALH